MKPIRRIFLIAVIAVMLFCSCSTKDTDSIVAIAPEEGKLVLYNCTIIDGTGAAPLEGMYIYINDGRIESIVDAEAAAMKAAYQPVDLKGYTLLPGFINTHVHCMFSEDALKTWLQHGVTTVREMAARDGTDFAGDRDQLNENDMQARLVTSTPPLTKPGGYIPRLGVGVDTPEEAAAKTQEYLDMNPDVVKIAIEDNLQGRTWNMLTADEIKSITTTAHEGNTRVAAHISHARNLTLALEGNVDELSHMVVEPVSKEVMDQIAAKGIFWVPTLELWKNISNLYELDWDKTAVSNLAMFYEAGGKIALGTDYGGFRASFDPGMPMTELQLMQEAGMTNMDIIVAATKNASVLCGMASQLGTLEAGKLADMIVVRGDPLEDIKALESLYMVIHNGSIAVTYEE